MTPPDSISDSTYTISATIWLYPGTSGWHFITIDSATSDLIDKHHHHLSRGFGSLPVQVSIGNISWRTSIFPDKKSGGYILPLKAQIRKQASLSAGDHLHLSLSILT